jgi:hypothetical protein
MMIADLLLYGYRGNDLAENPFCGEVAWCLCLRVVTRSQEEKMEVER